jgi:hypothetical protein
MNKEWIDSQLKDCYNCIRLQSKLTQSFKLIEELIENIENGIGIIRMKKYKDKLNKLKEL